MEVRTYNKKLKKFVTKSFIGGYVSSLREKRGSGRAEKRDAWYWHAYRHLHSFLSCNDLLPENPHKESGWKTTVQAYHDNRVHMDSGNILKGLEDVLVWKINGKGKGTFFFNDDKLTAGEYKEAKYCKDNPRVEVTIERKEDHGA